MKFTLTREQHHEIYYYMKLNRELEDAMVRLFRQNKILCGIYQSLGQEGISVGTAYALDKEDWLAPMIRNIGALLVKGFRPRDIFTQHMARLASPTKGKDSTSHLGDYKKHVIAPISMLGDLIPVMTGVAMAGRYLGHNIVALTWIGDGGSSTGAFHEGMGLAASQRAPLVVVIENNQWAYSTPVGRQVPLENLADRAKSYGIPSFIVDGNDVLAVYDTTKQAVELCRSGGGPVIIEAKTHRMKGHAQHDPAGYVPKKLVEYWRAQDPIARFEKYLTEKRLWTEAEKNEILARIQRELTEDEKFSEESPLPPPEMAAEGVYCEGCHDIRPEWRRPVEEVTPPRSCVKAEWAVKGFGAWELTPAQQDAMQVTPNGERAAVRRDGKRPAGKARRKSKPARVVKAKGRR